MNTNTDKLAAYIEENRAHFLEVAFFSCPPGMTPEDLLQETIVALLRSITTQEREIDWNRSYRNYIITFIKMQGAMHRVKRARPKRVAILQPLTEQVGGARMEDPDLDRQMDVRAAIEFLFEGEDREIVWAHLAEGATGQEIVARFPHRFNNRKTVSQWILNKAIPKLKKRLQSYKIV